MESSPIAYLNRYQFIEVLVLLAIDKYHESETEMAIPIAVRRLIDEDLLPKIWIVSKGKIRKRQFYTKEVNALFVFNEEPLQFAFAKYAGADGIKWIP